MTTGRVEAFSDGVVAIIITIMVLELKLPAGGDLASLRPLLPVFFSYVLSFIYVGIYWNNHHHLFQVCEHVNGKVLWANLHLLFWLSLVPFATSWMGTNHFATAPVAIYGALLLCAGTAYYILSRALIALHGRESALARSVGQDFKGLISMAIYAIAIPVAWVRPWIAFVAYVGVAIIWLIPDPRIERTQASNEGSG